MGGFSLGLRFISLLNEPTFTENKPISVLRQSCAGSLDNTTNVTMTVYAPYSVSQGLDALLSFFTYICVVLLEEMLEFVLHFVRSAFPLQNWMKNQR